MENYPKSRRFFNPINDMNGDDVSVSIILLLVSKKVVVITTFFIVEESTFLILP